MTPAVTSHSCLGAAFGDVGGQGQLHQVHLSVLGEVELTLPGRAQGQRLLGPITTHSLSEEMTGLNPGREEVLYQSGHEAYVCGKSRGPEKRGDARGSRTFTGNLAGASGIR